MKIGISAILLFLLSFSATQASALNISPTEPIPKNAGLLITAYGTSIAQSSLDLVQVYNSNDHVFSLDGWWLGIITNLQTSPQPIHTLTGYMKAESHGIYVKDDEISGAGVLSFSMPPLAVGEKLTKVVLMAPIASWASPEQPIATTDGVYRRGLTSTGYSSSTTFAKLVEPITLYADELYTVPSTPMLRIVEVVARHAECAPNDLSVVCGDYVKLQNVSEAPIDTSLYRLRSDSGTSESGNAFSLNGLLDPGAYLTVSLRDDGDKLSLTDSGGYVWLEDIAGIVQYYDETTVQYPSASSTTKIGWAWAQDAVDGIWKWTSTPRPDTENVITVPAEVVAVTTGLGECPAGKYRNPETNRCRSLEEAVNVLAQCDEGKERNPITNRCRSVASVASAVLAPCDEGKERNPATNRCRAVASVSASALVPCQTGYDRNPATNRCRKAVASTTGGAAETEVVTAENSSLQTALLIVAGAGAVSYGIYEWRTELLRGLRRVIPAGRK